MADLNHGTMFGVVLVAVFATAQPVAAASSEFVQLTSMVAAELGGRQVAAFRAPDFTERRPAALVPLYVSFATLQVADARSTYVGVREGLVELNPLMKGAAHSPLQLTMMKLAATTCTIAASELLWRTHRKGTVFTMVVLNVAYGVIVANNVRLMH
jgi:hypothetical protein